MKFKAELNVTDKDTPIERADAIIRWHMDRACIQTEDERIRVQEELGEFVEHIQTWLKYNRLPGARRD